MAASKLRRERLHVEISGHRLLRFEQFETIADAIAREKQLKRWHRQWKINLIESGNPHWADLAPAFGLPPLTS